MESGDVAVADEWLGILANHIKIQQGKQTHGAEAAAQAAQEQMTPTPVPTATPRLEGDGSVIPNYLTPPLLENTEYYYFTNKPENFVLFKADGDQDRPNLK